MGVYLFGCAYGWIVHWSISPFLGQSVSLLVGRSGCWSVSPLNSRLAHQIPCRHGFMKIMIVFLFIFEERREIAKRDSEVRISPLNGKFNVVFLAPITFENRYREIGDMTQYV